MKKTALLISIVAATMLFCSKNANGQIGRNLTINVNNFHYYINNGNVPEAYDTIETPHPLGTTNEYRGPIQIISDSQFTITRETTISSTVKNIHFISDRYFLDPLTAAGITYCQDTLQPTLTSNGFTVFYTTTTTTNDKFPTTGQYLTALVTLVKKDNEGTYQKFCDLYFYEEKTGSGAYGGGDLIYVINGSSLTGNYGNVPITGTGCDTKDITYSEMIPPGEYAIAMTNFLQPHTESYYYPPSSFSQVTDENFIVNFQLDIALTNDLPTEIVEINTNITNIQNNISTLQTGLDTANANIATNATDIATNTADIATNTADIATNTADIEGLKTDMTTAKTDIKTNADDVDNLQDKYNDLEAKYNALNQSVMTQSTSNAKNASTTSGSVSSMVNNSLPGGDSGNSILQYDARINGEGDTVNNVKASDPTNPTGKIPVQVIGENIQ